ncbi:lysozyme [Oricola thermophila]|uniref:Lysozyme n=1 Tax=Oricola thermophila TaxID=2742145 RepID=A0A6N1VML3_9HYPH|nr:lysozyme [Oricola thermophila]QKV20227.1 lysozyme [Oricola thermophila]
MSKRARKALAGAAGLAGAIAVATTALIQPWEGREYVAYRDIVGVLTICDGDTQNVRPGMVETDAGCDERTHRRITREFVPALRKCVATFDAAPVSWQAAAISLSWNIGTGAFCSSTAARRARSSDWLGSCEAMTWFNRAGGKRIRGLVLRRTTGDAERIGEYELCVEGL